MREAGFGLKAATVTPEGKDDVGSPNRILREEVDGKVIVRTGRRIPGVVGPVSGVYHPISVVRMAVDDAYGAKQWREGEGDGRGRLPDAEDHARHLPRGGRVLASGWPSGSAPRSTAGRSGRSPRSTRACSRRRWTRPPSAIPTSSYQPVLIDALYAGLISGAADSPLVIPALNRDGDCLSDLVLPMFGSIAGAESVLLALRRRLRRRGRDGRGPARHRAVADGQGPGEPDGDAARLRIRALLRGDQGLRGRRARLARGLRVGARGDRDRHQDVDLGGHATTSEFTDAVDREGADQDRDLVLARN